MSILAIAEDLEDAMRREGAGPPRGDHPGKDRHSNVHGRNGPRHCRGVLRRPGLVHEEAFIMSIWRRKKFRLASVTGVGGAPDGWAVARKSDSRIVAFYHHKDEAQLAVQRANQGELV